jgi:hypothetical protein
MSFWCLQFFQKTNENNSTWGTIVVRLNFFVWFLEELKTPKRHFEINWPFVFKGNFLVKGGCTKICSVKRLSPHCEIFFFKPTAAHDCVWIGKFCALSIYSTFWPRGLLHHQVFATINWCWPSISCGKTQILCNDKTKNSKTLKLWI